MADEDRAIDELFQLPLDEFTPARNALAKRLGRSKIKDLQKPNIAAWAVNQLYWRHRPVFERLMKASEQLRAEHRKLLAGKSSDIREAEKAHREIVREAVDQIKGLLSAAHQAATPGTMTAVAETLEALPGGDPPGRLTRPLKPRGFEALSGVTLSPTRPVLRVVNKPGAVSPRDAAREKEQEKQREKEERERQRAAEKEAREAKAEVARTEAAVQRARAAVEKAEKRVDELRAELDRAKAAYHRARMRARQ
jgi:hypothetical protein